MMTTVSAVCTVGEKLKNLIVAEGVFHDEVVQLRSDLDVIEKCLVSKQSDGGGNNSIDDISGDVLKQVRQLAYEIEDAVECYAGGEQAESYFRCVWSPPEDFSLLKVKINEVNNAIGAAGSTTRSSGGRTPPKRRVSYDRAPSIFWMMNEVSYLKYGLVERQSSDDVLSISVISGPDGMGRTTLARMCYDDSSVKEYFDIRAWVTVSQNFQARDILETILHSLDSTMTKDEIAEFETMELINQLHKAQKEKRYLIVLDDIWSLDDWNTLRFAFRNDRNGSRILITTSVREFGNIADFVICVRAMCLEEGRDFLNSRSGPLDDPDMQVNPEMQEIAETIVCFCKGIPVVIAVIGGALRNKNLEEWKEMGQILRDRISSSFRGYEALDLLDVGYNQLPLHLKPCFLYLGYFPHGQPIPVEKLCLLWIAEGLISISGSNIDKFHMEVAEEYFGELFDRSLVIVVENEEGSPSTRFKSYKLNDSIRDICIRIGEEEDFFKVVHGNGITTPTGRVAVGMYTHDVVLNMSQRQDIRSILFYDINEPHSKKTRPSEIPDLAKFRRTRLLDFDGVDFRVKNLPRGIQKLIYLRYLSFQGCYLHEFPSSFSNFPFLETLDLRVRVSCVMTISNVLRKLSSLKHLYFPLAFRCDNTNGKLRLDTLTKLQVLENFDACLCDVDDLLQLENLRVLTVSVDGNNMDLKKIMSRLNKNKLLSHSSLVVKKFDSYTKERLTIVAALLECNSLHGLNIEGYLGMTLLHEGIGSNFTSMVFNGSEFSEDPMSILGKLRNLRSLVLCNDAFVATKMVCSESDFPQLTSLELATLQLLEKWEVEGEVFMPRLAILTIENCHKLEEIPPGLSKIQTLREIKVRSMPKEFQDKVRETTNKLVAPFSYEY